MRRLDQAWETGGHFERLHMFACGGHDPDWFKQYIQYEEAADVLKMYHGKTVPALAQTQTYAEALLKAAGRSAEAEAESRARTKRQKVLQRENPRTCGYSSIRRCSKTSSEAPLSWRSICATSFGIRRPGVGAGLQGPGWGTAGVRA